jgi:methionyl-tRNA formyltransferase
MGMARSALTFFRMDTGADSGNILLQEAFDLPAEATIVDFNETIDRLARPLTAMLVQRLSADPSWQGIPQSSANVNYWRKRTPHDVTIDFRMHAESIAQLVRSFTTPYPCANLVTRHGVIKVVEARVRSDGSPEVARMEPGKIASIDGCVLIVKAADTLIELVIATDLPEEFAHERYIHPPSRYLVEHGIGLPQ